MFILTLTQSGSPILTLKVKIANYGTEFYTLPHFIHTVGWGDE